MLSATTAESRDSTAARIAIVSAGKTKLSIVDKFTLGIESDGREEDKLPKTLPMVGVSKLKVNVITVVNIIAKKAEGIFC